MDVNRHTYALQGASGEGLAVFPGVGGNFGSTSHMRGCTLALDTNDSSCWRGCGERGTLLHCWWECQLVQPLGKSVWQLLKKMGMSLPQDPAIPLLGIYPKEAHSYNKDISSTMFIAALFVKARNWKQSRCPSTEEWTEKMWYIYTMEYSSAEKNNGILKFAGK